MNRKQYQICCLAATAKQAMIEKEDIKFKAADDVATIEFRFLPELEDTAMPVDEDGNGYVAQDVTEWYPYCMDDPILQEEHWDGELADAADDVQQKKEAEAFEAYDRALYYDKYKNKCKNALKQIQQKQQIQAE